LQALKDREFSRVDRVAATIKRLLAGPISELARAQNAGLVTITHVTVSSDLKYANVSLSIYGSDDGKIEFVRLLKQQAYELQSVLGRELRTRRTPVLSFELDEGIERDDRINRLLASKPLPDAGA
jgi:ribosome-binding factor A